MKKRAKPVGKKAEKKAAKKAAGRKPAATSPAAAAKGSPAKPAPPRPAGASRAPSPADRAVVEAARYTPAPVQSTGWPPFRYPPR